jgi:dihydrofolate synthase/folylpolyglutamate synthase
MKTRYTEEQYQDMLQDLFRRFPSFQQAGTAAYKPGIDNMLVFDQLTGHPHRKFKTIHVAGTNGKGSVSSMLTSVLSASGIRTGLFTSPHILDFRERARIVQGDELKYISRDFIWDFCERWHDTFDHLDLSLFEISTMMAFEWFASEDVEVAVIETGLGGRFDSTNIVTPVLSVITNIGLDHCNILGETLPEIAFEKAGIIKPCVPVVVGESDPEIDSVFERKVLYTNLPEPKFMGSRTEIMSLLTFADKVYPTMWDKHEEILSRMDLQGACQKHNLRTVLAALDVLDVPFDRACVAEAIERTAARTDFHGRWERIMEDPMVICDIGHNEHGLKLNMKRLSDMLAAGECGSLVIVYGIMSDKDFHSIAHLLPAEAHYVFTSAPGPRALPAEALAEKYVAYCAEKEIQCAQYQVEQDPSKAIKVALEIASDMNEPLIYVGGSTYVVAEIIRWFKEK